MRAHVAGFEIGHPLLPGRFHRPIPEGLLYILGVAEHTPVIEKGKRDQEATEQPRIHEDEGQHADDAAVPERGKRDGPVAEAPRQQRRPFMLVILGGPGMGGDEGVPQDGIVCDGNLRPRHGSSNHVTAPRMPTRMLRPARRAAVRSARSLRGWGQSGSRAAVESSDLPSCEG